VTTPGDGPEGPHLATQAQSWAVVGRPPTTVAELLARRAEDDGPGLLFGDDHWSWREVVALSRAAGERLRRVQGDGPFHVGVLMENTPEYLFTLFGAALSGAAVVGINSTRRGSELARDITHTDCRVVVTDTASAPLLDGLDLPGIPVILTDHDRLPAVEGPATATEAPGPDDLFVLIFTSGSTGAPKAVRMSHGRAARMAAASSWFSADDVLYSAMPLFHGNALNAIVLPALGSGAAIALRPRFSASQFMPDVRRYGATFFSTVGRALSYVLATPASPADRDHKVAYALAPEASVTDCDAFRHRFGIRCIAGYGSSENTIVMVPVPGCPAALGRPQEGVDIAVVDPETGEERPAARFDDAGRLLNAGEAIGEIVGRNVLDRFEGYYRNPTADAERGRNGWYWSGDLGYRDEAGVFWFAGRVGEWLRVDSENFAVGPVERILSRYPPARAVAVFPVPDERTADDQVMAAIELAGDDRFDPAGFAAFLAAQPDLAPKWAPRYVRLTTLPVGATHKVDKRALRAQRWFTDDPVWWRPKPGEPYRELTVHDLAALAARFREHGRAIDRP
jgi:fatty-acyl-CoA synthase